MRLPTRVLVQEARTAPLPLAAPDKPQVDPTRVEAEDGVRFSELGLAPTKAFIQLSLRHKSDGHLWFSFFHEAGHILLHSKKETFITAESPRELPEEENQANSFAATWLIPQRFDAKLRQLRTDADIRQFADEPGIAPGIVVGRLQKEKLIEWSRGNSLKRWFKFVES